MVKRFRRTGVLSFFALALAVAVVVLHRVFVTTYTGRYVETASITGSLIGFSRIDELVYGVLDVVSVASVVAAVVLVVVFALLRRRFVLAAAAATMIVGANVSTQVLKRYVLERPDLESALPGGVLGTADNTLPSGHTTVALSVAVAVVLVVPARVRGVVAILAAGYGALTGVGTLSARWHRPSDVIAACLVVGAWAAAVGAVALLLSRRSGHHATLRTGAFSSLTLIAVVTLALGGLAMVLTARTDPAELQRAGLFVAYAGGAAAIVGACAAVLAGTLLMAPWVVADGYHGRREPAPPQPARDPRPVTP